MVLAALAGLWMLLRYGDNERASTLWVSGLLFGVAFVMKQHGMFFGIFAAGWLVATGRWKKVPLFLSGAVTPFALTCLWLWRAGVFAKFWFWTFTYARQYVSETSLSEGAQALWETLQPIFWQCGTIWVLAALQLVLALLLVKKGARSAWFLPAFLLLSFVATCPGLYFRAHYMVLMLPAIALLAGSTVRGRGSAWLFAVVLLYSLLVQRDFLFRMSPTEVSRELYGQDPFPEAIPIAAYIRRHTSENQRIAVLGSEPEIYFYSHRHSATPYLYIEPMVEQQPFALQMQNDMVHDLEQAQPEYMVRFPAEETLSLGPDSPTRLRDWWADYGPSHYRLVAVADVLADGRTEYRWDDAAESYRPQSLYYLAVYKKR